ncbi:hypothetical protein G114_09735 [Aeromonas diversa CDC 2478-85]|uniref:Uncharacterized protein n=1 Tax=Aeromonas diversa CDC 2478-85 TaxID=1268237 RepID=N9U152_9GAMM|nr:hypothetical protein [Aeromonas diversa]ENY72045.1 hypothetical protein G114_09735 [Aeromonas diversa CDC 2478-85]
MKRVDTAPLSIQDGLALMIGANLVVLTTLLFAASLSGMPWMGMALIALPPALAGALLCHLRQRERMK